MIRDAVTMIAIASDRRVEDDHQVDQDAQPVCRRRWLASVPIGLAAENQAPWASAALPKPIVAA